MSDRFIIASLLTTLGSSLTNIALAYQFLLKGSDPSTEYGVILYASTLVSVLFAARIGRRIDGQLHLGSTLLWVNVLSAICSVGYALSSAAIYSAAIVLISTVCSIASSAAAVKAARIYYVGKRLENINITLNEIASIGMVFGPLIAPFLASLGISVAAFYLLDSLTFIVAGMLYRSHFAKLRSPIPASGTHKKPSAFVGWSIVKSRELAPFFLAFVPFALAGSGLIYTLALLAKQVAAGDLFLYSAPILAMFAGRLIAMRTLRKGSANARNYGTLFGWSLICAAGFTLPMGLTSNIVIFCMLEFGLGMAYAVNLLAARMLIQRLAPIESLATAQALTITVEKVAKLTAVPVLVYTIGNWGTYAASALLAFAFLMASACAAVHLPTKFAAASREAQEGH